MELQPINVEGNVIFGADGQLFLASDRHFTLDFLQGKRNVSERSLRNFAANLRIRAILSRRAGAKHMHLVAPDKHAVYPAQFPIKNFASLIEKYHQRTENGFIYPVDELKAIGGGYGRTDTHWSIRGQMVIARLLAVKFGLDALTVDQASSALEKGVHLLPDPVAGDLGGKLTPPHTEPMERLEFPWRLHGFSNEMRAGNDGRIQIFFSESPFAKGRLLVFGDSFIAQTLPALAAFFKELVFCRTRFFHHDMVVATKPDYVLTENVERYLIKVQTDSEAPPMLLMAQLAGKDVRMSDRNLRAFAAILAPRSTAYKEFLDSLAGSGAD